MIDNAIRRLNKLPPGTTIHWVGHDTGYRSRCQCPQFRDAPFAAPFDKNRWAAQVEGGGPNVTGPPTPSDLPLSDLQYDILAALLRLKATSPDQGQKSETLALKLPNKPSPTVLKEAARPMVSRYIDSKSGPGGGYWLTDAGRQLTERVQNR
jgi:hypothetical protein